MFTRDAAHSGPRLFSGSTDFVNAGRLFPLAGFVECRGRRQSNGGAAGHASLLDHAALRGLQEGMEFRGRSRREGRLQCRQRLHPSQSAAVDHAVRFFELLDLVARQARHAAGR